MFIHSGCFSCRVSFGLNASASAVHETEILNRRSIRSYISGMRGVHVRGPKGRKSRINIGMPQTMISGIPLRLDLGTRMCEILMFPQSFGALHVPRVYQKVDSSSCGPRCFQCRASPRKASEWQVALTLLRELEERS